MTDSKDPKQTVVFRSPKSLVKSPRFHDPITSLLFSKSPSLKSNCDDIIPEDEIFNEVVEIIAAEERNVWISGLILLFGTVFFWIISVQILSNVMKKTDFNHPLLAAYFNGGFFIFFGLRPVMADLWSMRKKILNQNYSDTPLVQDEIPIYDSNTNDIVFDGQDTVDSKILLTTPKIQLSHNSLIKVSLLAAFLYFLNCFLGSTSLKYTSASNQTILATSSSVFSLIIGVLLKFEKFTIGKVLSVFCSICGIILITFSSSSPDTLLWIKSLSSEELGDILATIGACSYSCFLALLRIKLGEQTNSENDSLLYGYIGLMTFLFGFPVLLIFDFFSWENLGLPDNKIIFVMLLLSSLLNALSDYCGSCAALITSPLSVSLSLSTAIPISMFLDSYFNGGLNFTLQYFIGIILILSSFIFINLSNEQEIVENAIGNAVEEAINYDEQLSVYLSPRLPPIHSKSDNIGGLEIPGLSIDHAIEESQPRLVITGGQNHKYFLRETRD